MQSRYHVGVTLSHPERPPSGARATSSAALGGYPKSRAQECWLRAGNLSEPQRIGVGSWEEGNTAGMIPDSELCEAYDCLHPGRRKHQARHSNSRHGGGDRPT